MKIHKTITTKTEQLDELQCDICKKKFKDDISVNGTELNWGDENLTSCSLQEKSYSYGGAYYSHKSLDLCPLCMYRLIYSIKKGEIQFGEYGKLIKE